MSNKRWVSGLMRGLVYRLVKKAKGPFHLLLPIGPGMSTRKLLVVMGDFQGGQLPVQEPVARHNPTTNNGRRQGYFLYYGGVIWSGPADKARRLVGRKSFLVENWR